MNAPPDPTAVRAAPSLARYVVLAALCVATTIAYVDRGCIGVAILPMRDELGLTPQEVGWVHSTFYIAYAVVQLPAGWLGHIWGTRRALPVFSLLWSAATGVAGLAMGLPLLLLSRLGLGAAEAGIFPCVTTSIARWFPATQRALMSGLAGSFQGVGAAIGALLTGLALTQISWRWVFLIYMLPGIAWAVWFYVWYRDRPEDHPEVNAAELDLIRAGVPLEPARGKGPAEPTPWLAIFTSPAMLWISAQQFFKAAGVIFFLSWFPTYLQETRGVKLADLGTLASMPHAAMILGAIAGGWLSDELLVRTGSRRIARQGQSAVSLVLCGILGLLAYPIESAWLSVTIISVGAFCAGLSGPCAYAITIDMGGKYIAPIFSTMNMAGNVGAVLFPIAVPWLVRATGNWDAVLILFAGLYVAAGLCWLPFNPNGRIIEKDAP